MLVAMFFTGDLELSERVTECLRTTSSTGVLVGDRGWAVDPDLQADGRSLVEVQRPRRSDVLAVEQDDFVFSRTGASTSSTASARLLWAVPLSAAPTIRTSSAGGRRGTTGSRDGAIHYDVVVVHGRGRSPDISWTSSAPDGGVAALGAARRPGAARRERDEQLVVCWYSASSERGRSAAPRVSGCRSRKSTKSRPGGTAPTRSRPERPIRRRRGQRARSRA